MIITKQKPWAAITKCLGNAKKVFLVGCGECATTCKSGGEEEILDIKVKLEAEGKEVTGYFIGDSDCHILDMKRQVRLNKQQVAAAEAVIVYSCGAGTQSFSEILKDKPVYAGNDTLFLGNIQRFGNFIEHCSLCGECVINETAGICPITNCPKSLLNGPCGGMDQGNCEIDPDRECVWVKIYKRLEILGQLDKMKQSMAPKNHQKNSMPHALVLERKGGEISRD